MKKYYQLLCLILLTLSIQAHAITSSRTLPNGFEKNKGQVLDATGSVAEEVLYVYRTPQMDLFVTTSGLSYVFHDTSLAASKSRSALKLPTGNVSRADMLLKDATINLSTASNSGALRATPTIYYNRQNTSGIKDVAFYRSITFKNVYPGIDWVLYAGNNGDYDFKYDFVVQPGGDPSQIKMEYLGADLKLNADQTELQLQTTNGKLSEGKLLSYQHKSSNSVASNYILNDNELSFNIAHYNQNQTLTIDPPVIVWSTNFGGSGSDYITDTVVDGEDNLYIYGKTRSTTLPGLIGDGNMGRYDIFITKFDTHGTLQWSVMFGGTGNDDIEGGIAVTPDGQEIYFAGAVPSHDFPILEVPGAYNQDDFSGGNSGFIAKINPEGLLLWSTFISSETFTYIRDVAIKDNAVFIMGFTSGQDFPIVEKPGAYNQANNNGGLNDGLLIQLDANDNLAWSTYFGGSGTDQMSAMDFNPEGHLFIVGNTDSNDFPIVEKTGAYNSSIFDEFDETQAVIMEFDPAGALVWSTFFGGSNYENARSLNWDEAGNLYVVGETESPDMPIVELPGAYNESTLQNPVQFYLTDAFMVRFTAAGEMDWSTYMGGDKADLATAIEFDEQGNMWLGGAASSQNFPIMELEDAFNQTSIEPNVRVMFWSVFDENRTLKWSTYYGGDDFGWNSGFQKRSNSRLLMFTQASSSEGLASGLIAEDPLAYTQGDINSNDVVIIEFITDSFTMGSNSFNLTNTLSIYPNPVNELMTVLSSEEIQNITVYSTTGNLIETLSINNKQQELNFSHYPEGIYLLKISTSKGSAVKKIIVSH